MTSHSTSSKPGTSRGRSASVAGSVSSSLRQGIWMMSFMRGRAGATGRAERSTPYTRWRPVSHMASATITRPAPGPDPAAGRRRPALGRGRVLALVGRLRWAPLIGFLRLPDLSQLRQLLLAAVGPRAAARASSRPSTATARRPSTRSPSPSARCSRSSAIRPTGSWSAPRSASFVVLVRRPLPPGARRRSRRSSAWPPPPCCARASTSRSWPRAPTSTSRTWRFVVWAAALEAERPRRGTVVFVLLALRRAAAPGGVAAERPVLAVVHRARHLAAARHATPVAHRRPARDLDRSGLVGDRRPDVLAAPTPAAWPRSSGAPAAGCPTSPARRVKFLQEPRQGRRSSTRGSSASSSRCCSRRGARACRWRCWSSAWAPSCSSALAGLSVIDRYLLVPSLLVMVFAAVALAGWTMLRSGRARTLWARGRRSRSSSTAWPSRPPGSTSPPSPTS